MVFNFKIESSGGDHSQEGVSLSKEEWEGGKLGRIIWKDESCSMRAGKGNRGLTDGHS